MIRRRHLLALLATISLIAISVAAANTSRAADAPSDKADCQSCHGDRELTTTPAPGSPPRSLWVDTEALAKSVHADFECVDCHPDASEAPHPHPPAAASCESCHPDAQDAVASTVHGQALARGDAAAPRCGDCHGAHDILPVDDPRSPVHPLGVASTCARCHSSPDFAKQHTPVVSDPLAQYRDSVHGIAILTERNPKAASCTSCHGSHEIRDNQDPASSIFPANVARTCGTCHERELADYRRSVHGEAFARGVREAPTCTDCHGEHHVEAASAATSPVNPRHVSAETCGRCHGSDRLAAKFNLPSQALATFSTSFHGLALEGGDVRAANCASCHGNHRVLRSTDPESSIFPANLPTTCGRCHPDAGANVTRGSVHLTSGPAPGRIVRWGQRSYLGLIVVVIGGMTFHNGLDFVRRSQRRIRARGRGAHP